MLAAVKNAEPKALRKIYMEVLWQTNPEALHYGKFTLPFPHSHKVSALSIFKRLFPNSVSPFASKGVNKRF